MRTTFLEHNDIWDNIFFSRHYHKQYEAFSITIWKILIMYRNSFY
jgi:hypothetical protein